MRALPCVRVDRRSRPTTLASPPPEQATLAKGKLRLMRKATELAVQCNAQVALVMFDASGRLTQFSTSAMDQVLEHYGQAVVEPHERYTPHDVRGLEGWKVGCATRGCGSIERKPVRATLQQRMSQRLSLVTRCCCTRGCTDI